MFFNFLLYKLLPPVHLLTVPVLFVHFFVSLAIVTALCTLSRRYFEEFFLRQKDKLVPYTRS